MSFVKKEWKDRIVEFAGRRKLTNITSGNQDVVDVVRAEGAVSQEGDMFDAENMNDLEQRISTAFNGVNSDLAERTIKTYTSLEQIGLTTGSETIADIATNLPSNSELLFAVSSSNANIYPYTGGSVRITRTWSGRVKFEFWTANASATDKLYVGIYGGTSWSGWEKIALNSDLALIDSRDEVTDLIAEADKGIAARRIVLTNPDTLNTPYKAGLTGGSSAGVAYINMTTVNYGEILYFVSGKNQIYSIHKSAGTWGDWDKIMLNSDLASQVLNFQNKTVATSEWIEGSDFGGYSYYAEIACAGVTSAYVPNVIFYPKDASSGNYAPAALINSNNVVKIYAKEKPNNTLSIPTIQCIKSV